MIRIKKKNLEVSAFETGHLHRMIYDGILINQVLQNPLETRLGQIYLRTGGESFPLIIEEAVFSYSDSALKYEGSLTVGSYTVLLKVQEMAWFYEVEAEINIPYDLIYIQDLGLADIAAVRTNEAYVAQYTDYKIVDAKRGKVVLARQNMPQGDGGFPKVELGSFQKIERFITDGFDFYGLGYKLGAMPEGLQGEGLKNRKKQYEMAMVGLQTGSMSEKITTIFYGLITKNAPEASKDAADFALIKSLYRQVKDGSFQAGQKMEQKIYFGSDIVGEPVKQEYLKRHYPERFFEEKEGNELLAFFTPSMSHVVLQEKEKHVERSHGMVMLDQVDLFNPGEALAATAYMQGVFHSHVVMGNTNMNKFSSHQRNPLNLLRTSGLRVYIRKGDVLHNLTMPTLFEMWPNRCRWMYDLEDDALCVETWLTNTSKEVKMKLGSMFGKQYDFVLSHQVSMGPNEYENEYVREERDGRIIYRPVKNAVYPKMAYAVSGNFDEATNESFVSDAIAKTSNLEFFHYAGKSEVEFNIQASLDGKWVQEKKRSKKERSDEDYYKELVGQFELKAYAGSGNLKDFAQKYNLTTYWYTHQMLIHYASPHGLEQGSGAAWGCRDVCQGPFEFFLATGRIAEMRKLILTVYSHQFLETGDWPQWFMFDKYRMQQDESHGDIIVWPLRIVGDYLDLSDDLSILDEKVPYLSEKSGNDIEPVSILEHLEHAVATMESHFMPGTTLSNYGDGDWDDTLQPANKELKKGLVSSWTVALTYQAMKKLGEKMPNGERYDKIAEAIKADFNKVMLGETDVIPGFVYIQKSGQIELIIHPNDKKTNMEYRLIPMTRSIISELVSPGQMKKNFAIIDENLLCPDGVRLMNKPAHYAGGISVNFKRGEQAANIGREIGLQYVHAHIRYIESLAKVGDTRTIQMLDLINPIDIVNVVPNAIMRQSNTYFSSSDADFLDRYQAEEEWDKVKTGEIGVKGGWRIYSSGPGIYLNQVIRNVLGIRQTKDTFLFDPVLPAYLDGLQASIELDERLLKITFLHGAERAVVIAGKTYKDMLENPYRAGALVIPKEELPLGRHEIKVVFISVR